MAQKRRLTELHKDKIRTTALINRLQKHVLATKKADLLTSSQVTAALGLLKKTMPDMQSAQVDMSGDVEIRVIKVAS
ncbi:MAG: hypothetical protein HKM98_02540 [Gammaproteobacteria bacterium]|nr:hypothetical protein [Gammaproteobacteria bacterium]